jgi:hypothetical protein
VVWKPREGAEENAVESWLERLHLRLKGKARVFVVATHADAEGGRRADIDEPGLQAKFPGLIVENGFFHVDSLTGKNVDKLLQAIQAEALSTAHFPHMGQPFPRAWRAAADELAAREEMYLRKADFDAVCHEHGLDAQSSQTLLRILHIRGSLVCYTDEDGLNDYVVLKPEWLTKAISFVLEDEQTAKNQGYLEHRRLTDIWEKHGRKNEPSYGSDLHSFLLRLMEQFDISYRVPEEEGKKSLIGQMVPYERPRLPEFVGPRVTRLSYEMHTAPPGLMPWLIVRTHRFAPDRIHWRRGTRLGLRGQNALLELDARDRRLDLTVRGTAPEHFFHVLLDEIDSVMARWPGLSKDQYVPCGKVQPDGAVCTGRIRMESIQTAREKDKQVQCPKCLEDHDPNELLTGFARVHPTATLMSNKLEEVVKRALDAAQQRTEANQNELLSEFKKLWRQFNNPRRNGPSLFTLREVKEPGLVPPVLRATTLYELTLWCEHDGHWHPIEPSFPIPESKEWFKKIAPVARLVVNMLKLGLPVVGTATGVLVGEDAFKTYKPYVEFTEGLVKATPERDLKIHRGPDLAARGVTRPDDFSLADLHALLIKLDARKSDTAFGGLRRVEQNGAYYWVCEEHYPAYQSL